MKKVIMGILILIPIIILLVVALVSNFVATQAWIGVEDMHVYLKGTETAVEQLELNFNDVYGKNVNFYDYLDVEILPEKANRYTVEWQISGDVICTDSEYDDVTPAAYVSDEYGTELYVSTSGNFIIKSYCLFDVVVQAENVRKTFSVSVIGYDVERIDLKDPAGQTANSVKVGESIRLVANYNPIDSIVSVNNWKSDNESVATVDGNGVVTALGEGVANITVAANRKSDGELVTSSAYVLTVEKAGSKFGDKVVTSGREIDLEELGIDPNDVLLGAGYTVDGGKIMITGGDNVKLNLKDNSKVEIVLCDKDDIAIDNAEFYEHKDNENGYVLAVGDLSLKLNVSWADMLRDDDKPQIMWTSSDETIATVNENGEVTPKSDGIVIITATLTGSGAMAAESNSVSITLNVRNKVTALRLATSNGSLAVGLARETVFAAERFNVNSLGAVTGDPVNNFVFIHIQGEPKDVTEEQLRQYYEAYEFSIVAGGEFAQLDSTDRNKVIFKKEGLEGKGKQSVTVNVKAKYPRYEGNTRFTQQDVTLTVVYGVEVNSIAEMREALRLQKEYAKQDGNLIPEEFVEQIDSPNGVPTFIYWHKKSKMTYAISLMANIKFEEDGHSGDGEHGTMLLYGNLYGNNNTISAETGQLVREENWGMVRIAWDDITVSNIILRANQVPGDGVITDAEDVKSFTGIVVSNSGEENGFSHSRNNRIEYSIIENGERGIANFNSDITIDGSIIRNMIGIATYNPYRMYDYTKDGVAGIIPYYTKVTMNNMVFSNTVATIGSFVYERASVMYYIKPNTDGEHGIDPVTNKAYVPRFCATFEENREFFIANFVEKGYNMEFKQTGFLDVYNWQTTDNVRFIQTGDDNIDDIIGSAAGVLFDSSPTFENFRVTVDDTKYMHLGFMISGISIGDGIMDEPTFLKVELADKRFAPINTVDITYDGGGFLGTLACEALHGIPMTFYCYTKDSDLTPTSSYQLNDRFISHLHGEV